MSDYVERSKKGLEDSIQFFGNKCKPQRELWVLEKFLGYIPQSGVVLRTAEDDEEPNDVFYNGYGFQIKEIQTEGRERHKEYKQKLRSISSDTTKKELLDSYTPIKNSINECLPRIFSELIRHRKKYDENSLSINLLIYLNIAGLTITSEVDVIGSIFSEEFDKWASVSIITNNCACVLACSDKGHDFLNPLVGRFFSL